MAHMKSKQTKTETISNSWWSNRVAKLTEQPTFDFETKEERQAQKKIKLRFKELKGGTLSAYFDIYANGQRTYKFIQCHYEPETSRTDRAIQSANDETKAKILAKYITMVKTLAKESNTGWIDKDLSKIKIVDWLRLYRNKQQTRGRHTINIIDNLINLVEAYNGTIKIKDINKAYCLGFIAFLDKYVSTFTGRTLTKSTQSNRLLLLNCALNEAVRENVIAENPIAKITSIDKPKVPESKRVYLTIEELRKMIHADFRRENVKNAFLFSCFCGLRISDITALKWGNIINSNGQYRVELVMQKTTEPIFIPLSEDALRWLPNGKDKKPNENVFELPHHERIREELNRVAKSVGIEKPISFHTARHTFATMMLTLGADLYTTSKLLGHANITTTQIYAKIVDQKKTDAVNLTKGLF